MSHNESAENDSSAPIGAGVPIETAPTPAESPSSDETLRKFMDEISQLRTGLDRMHAIYRDLSNNLSSEKIFDSLMTGLSCHEGFIKMVRQLVIETNAEFISQHQQNQHGDHYALDEHPSVTGYDAKISLEPSETTMLRVGRNGSDHPTDPEGLTAFLKHEDNWVPVALPPKMAERIREALEESQAQPYTYYWVDLTAYSNAPIGEGSVSIAPAETEDGKEAG